MYGKIYSNTYNDALRQVDQLTVWRDILGYVGIGQLVSNPFRNDSNPGCFLREYNGVIFFMDFAQPEFNSYTCIHAVAHFKQVSLATAASYIIAKYRYGLHVSLTSNNIVQIVKTTNVKNTNKSISYKAYINDEGLPIYIPRDKLYWSIRGVSADQLRKHHVFSVEYLYIGDDIIHTNKPTYAYTFPESNHVKIYSPFDTKHKWLGTATKDDIWYSNDFPLSEIAIITKSLKDLMVIENIVDYDVYAFQNEGVIPKQLDFIAKHYKKVYVLYDNDTPGIKASNQLKQLYSNFEQIFIPLNSNCKDADEYYIKHGKEHLIQFFTESIQVFS